MRIPYNRVAETRPKGVPTNILALSGLIPEPICDTVRFISHDGSTSIAHYCGYAADFVSQVLEDDSIDGAVFPKSCDSTRAMASYLEDAGKFTFQLPVPDRRDELAVRFLATQIGRYRRAVESHYGVALDDVAERCEIVNERNAALGRLYRELPHLRYSAYLDLVHGLLTTPLREQAVPGTLEEADDEGVPVFVVGSLLSAPGVARALEGCGLRVVGDDLPESRRLVSAPPIDTSGDPMEAIARSIIGTPPSPTQADFASILDLDRREILRSGARGVVYVTQRFCEPYDFLFATYSAMLEGMGLPVLRVERVRSDDGRPLEAALEAFSDILRGA